MDPATALAVGEEIVEERDCGGYWARFAQPEAIDV